MVLKKLKHVKISKDLSLSLQKKTYFRQTSGNNLETVQERNILRVETANRKLCLVYWIASSLANL